LFVPLSLEAVWTGRGRFWIRSGPLGWTFEPCGEQPDDGQPVGGGGARGLGRGLRAYQKALAALRPRSRVQANEVRLEGGIGDPALGAVLFGALTAALVGTLEAHRARVRLKVRPALVEDRLALRGEGRVAFSVGAALWAAIRGVQGLLSSQ